MILYYRYKLLLRNKLSLCKFIEIEMVKIFVQFNAKCDIFHIINIVPKYTFRITNIWKIYISSQLLQQKTPLFIATSNQIYSCESVTDGSPATS